MHFESLLHVSPANAERAQLGAAAEVLGAVADAVVVVVIVAAPGRCRDAVLSALLPHAAEGVPAWRTDDDRLGAAASIDPSVSTNRYGERARRVVVDTSRIAPAQGGVLEPPAAQALAVLLQIASTLVYASGDVAGVEDQLLRPLRRQLRRRAASDHPAADSSLGLPALVVAGGGRFDPRAVTGDVFGTAAQGTLGAALRGEVLPRLRSRRANGHSLTGSVAAAALRVAVSQLQQCEPIGLAGSPWQRLAADTCSSAATAAVAAFSEAAAEAAAGDTEVGPFDRAVRDSAAVAHRQLSEKVGIFGQLSLQYQHDFRTELASAEQAARKGFRDRSRRACTELVQELCVEADAALSKQPVPEPSEWDSMVRSIVDEYRKRGRGPDKQQVLADVLLRWALPNTQVVARDAERRQVDRVSALTRQLAEQRALLEDAERTSADERSREAAAHAASVSELQSALQCIEGRVEAAEGEAASLRSRCADAEAAAAASEERAKAAAERAEEAGERLAEQEGDAMQRHQHWQKHSAELRQGAVALQAKLAAEREQHNEAVSREVSRRESLTRQLRQQEEEAQELRRDLVDVRGKLAASEGVLRRRAAAAEAAQQRSDEALASRAAGLEAAAREISDLRERAEASERRHDRAREELRAERERAERAAEEQQASLQHLALQLSALQQDGEVRTIREAELSQRHASAVERCEQLAQALADAQREAEVKGTEASAEAARAEQLLGEVEAAHRASAERSVEAARELSAESAFLAQELRRLQDQLRTKQDDSGHASESADSAASPSRLLRAAQGHAREAADRVGDLLARCERAEAEAAGLRRERSGLQAVSDSLAAEVADAQRQAEDARAQAAQERGRREEADHSRADLLARCDELAAEAAREREDLAAAKACEEERAAAAKAEASSQQARIDSLTADVAELEHRLKTGAAEAAEAALKIMHEQEVRRDTSSRLQQEERRLASAEKEVQRTREQLEEWQRQAAAAQQQTEEVRGQVAVLQSRLSTSEEQRGEADSAARELQAAVAAAEAKAVRAECALAADAEAAQVRQRQYRAEEARLRDSVRDAEAKLVEAEQLRRRQEADSDASLVVARRETADAERRIAAAEAAAAAKAQELRDARAEVERLAADLGREQNKTEGADVEVAELRSHNESLHRQLEATAADLRSAVEAEQQRHKITADRARGLETDLVEAGARAAGLQRDAEELVRVRGDLQQQQDAAASLREQLSEAVAEAAGLRSGLQAMQEWRDKTDGGASEYRKATEARVDEMRRESQRLQSEKETLRADLEALRAQLERSQKRQQRDHETAVMSRAQQSADHRDVARQLEDAQAALDASQQLAEKRLREVEELRAKLSEAEAALAKAQRDLEDQGTTAGMSAAQLERIEGRAKRLAQEKEELVSAKSVLTSERNRLTDQVRRLERQMQEERSKRRAVNRNLMMLELKMGDKSESGSGTDEASAERKRLLAAAFEELKSDAGDSKGVRFGHRSESPPPPLTPMSVMSLQVPSHAAAAAWKPISPSVSLGVRSVMSPPHMRGRPPVSPALQQRQMTQPRAVSPTFSTSSAVLGRRSAKPRPMPKPVPKLS